MGRERLVTPLVWTLSRPPRPLSSGPSRPVLAPPIGLPLAELTMLSAALGFPLGDWPSGVCFAGNLHHVLHAFVTKKKG